ncbi:sulfite exporter TauE/SafE family protein [Paenibacillus lycopersici]|uniref:Probable membrane transporter protein n=1 Tax=Paenibacillus lycopersici TaxID=2704462 RepID=A0A6C0G5U2_9BACL|nr:sulfite exporter TauE/SafE family protein [Paenibacillus lycopersici]QHT63611.1 sulfite exporter TauE/SafE family protein [Paenibacillus lycopersici]
MYPAMMTWDMPTLLIMFLLGLVASTFGAVVGLGGGVIIVPALLLLGPSMLGMDIDTTLAVGVSLGSLAFTSLASALTFVKEGKVDLRSALFFSLSSGPMSLVGASMTALFDPDDFRKAFGYFMLFMVVLLLFRSRIKPYQGQWRYVRTYADAAAGLQREYGFSALPALLIGGAVGLISGLLGIGGGVLLIPAMLLLFRFPPHIASATSMAVIFVSALFGSGMHLIRGEWDWLLVLALAPGSLLGGWLGARVSRRIGSTALIRIMCAALLLFAGRMIIT